MSENKKYEIIKAEFTNSQNNKTCPYIQIRKPDQWSKNFTFNPTHLKDVLLGLGVLSSSESEVMLFTKGKGDFVKYAIATLSEFKGKSYFSLRWHFKNEDEILIPTKKGITLPLSLLDEIMTELEKFQENEE